jgi:hypothetical protein
MSANEAPNHRDVIAASAFSMARRRFSFRAAFSAAFISFFATVAVATILISANMGSGAFARFDSVVPADVALIFLPLCALALAVIVEVIRLTLRGRLKFEPPAQSIRWKRSSQLS